MKRLAIILMISLLSSASVKAQQDLRDPRYIYHLEEEGEKYSIRKIPHYIDMPHNYGIAILYKGTLYKGVDFYEFFANHDLINYGGKHYNKPKKIAKYTDNQGVKKLYVVGEPLPLRKIQKIRSCFSKV